MRRERKVLVSGLVVTLVAAAITVGVVVAKSGSARNGLFWLKCGYSHSAADDMIVKPNLPGSAHLHDFFGNDSTDSESTYESLRAAGTECHLSNDTAAYWFPALIRADGSVVPPSNINAYYWGLENRTEAFPPNFREIAGATVGTPPQVGGHVYYQCQGTNTVKSATLPKCPAGSRVKAQVEFPSCWDGVVDADGTDNMAYPNGDRCPDGFTRDLPRLVEHVTWNTDDASTMHLATATDLHGETLHADFVNSWDQDKLQNLVDTCIRTAKSCKDVHD